jgi:hypothetical protein
MVQTRALGCVQAIEALWERLGIGPVLRKIAKEEGCTVPYERALLAMTANRLCEPASKLGVWDRWLSTVHLPSCWDLKLAQMYEAMDLLVRHAPRVEEAVFFQTADLLNLEVDLVFYDTTTASFTIDEEDGALEERQEGEGVRKRGPTREGAGTPRSWSPWRSPGKGSRCALGSSPGIPPMSIRSSRSGESCEAGNSAGASSSRTAG